MYEIHKDGALLSREDKARYVKLQSNGVYCLCAEHDATGVVVNNDYIESLAGVSVKEFNGAKKLATITAEGAALAQASTAEPSATVGVLAEGFPEWEPGAYYEKQYTLFTYGGKVGFTRQPGITAIESQPPFSLGLESVYGVRPVPDADGVFPYEYNMRASEGMKVREGDVVYNCYNPIDVMLFPPSQLAAHFEKID